MLQKFSVAWYSLGENGWNTLGENAWYIMGRKMTKLDCPVIWEEAAVTSRSYMAKTADEQSMKEVVLEHVVAQ